MRVIVTLMAALLAGATPAQDLTACVAGSYSLGTGGSGVSAQYGAGYNNFANGPNGWYANGGAADIAGNGVLTTKYVADDITPYPYLGGIGIDRFDWSVVNTSAMPVTARMRIRFHRSDGAGGGPGSYYTGWSFGATTFAANTWYHYYYSSLISLPSDPTFWFGITFDNSGHPETTADQLNGMGQMLFDPPAIGSSQDLYFSTDAASTGNVNNPPGGTHNFGGYPVANFAFYFDVPEPSAAAPLVALPALLIWKRRK